jgi:hypothetical protein
MKFQSYRRSWVKTVRVKKPSNFASRFDTLCKNYLKHMGNDEGIRRKTYTEGTCSGRGCVPKSTYWQRPPQLPKSSHQ